MISTPPEPADLGAIVGALAADLIELRRSLHAHPELSGEESHTAETVAEQLSRAGAEVTRHVGGHGVVGVLRGSTEGPTVGCRADMDALPMQDTLDRPYKSLILGVKHACGHDVHTTIALGVAHALAALEGHWAGSAVFLFQPAEESLSGAQAMLDAGVLEQHPLTALLALHVCPLPVGSIGLHEGLCLAGMEEFRVRFYAPSGNLEALVQDATAELTALSTASAPESFDAFKDVRRRMETDPTLRSTTFLSCWPEPAGALSRDHLMGLVSIADFDQRPAVRGRIAAALKRATAAYGAAYNLRTTFVNPPLSNDPALARAVRAALVETVGPGNVYDFQQPYPFAHEDFALFANRVPAVFFWLGAANPAMGIESVLHTPDFDVDEAAISIGAQAMTAALLLLLNRPAAPPQTPPARPERTPDPRA